MNETSINPPLILAPAGNRDSFLAAIAAGADAVYCGLKSFSARMAAPNFTIEELAALCDLARKKNIAVHVTLNSLIKPDEIPEAARTLDQLNRHVKPDGLIIQDTGMIALARQSGFKGTLHLSTLANVTFPAALKQIQSLGVSKVVLPREIGIDEIKIMDAACPNGLELEVFIHGALCYGISGRCYWSSFFGGKSGLRGRCVQPCRRIYTIPAQTPNSGKPQKTACFSCRDLELDVLVKTLMPLKNVRMWKIEGRKKGPHYVYSDFSRLI